VSPVKYELCFYIPEDDILRSFCRENVKSYTDESDDCSNWMFALYVRAGREQNSLPLSEIEPRSPGLSRSRSDVVLPLNPESQSPGGGRSRICIQ
jgi:hypothetical protein